MKKTKLRIDSLRVESFQTDGAARGPGTVHGHGTQPHQQTCAGSCGWLTCHTCPPITMDPSCHESCTCPIESAPCWETCGGAC